MTTLDQYLLDILSKGMVTKQDARLKAVNKDSFR
jgi:Tfp pilus assembly ATPase PilU